MSSTTEQQKEIPPRGDSVSPSKDDASAALAKSYDGMPPPAVKTSKRESDLPTELATLKLADNNVTSEKGKGSDVNKASDEEFFSDEEAEHKVEADENTAPKFKAETILKSESTINASTKKEGEVTAPKSNEEQVSHPIKVDENTSHKLTSETAPKLEDASITPTKNDETTTAKSDTTIAAVPTDETATPRLSAYINLHNDMMTSKSALASSADEQTRLHHHAEHVSRTLLASNAKHSDLPLVMHAHACMVLGCSLVDDCVEMMKEALILVNQAVKEGLLGAKEGMEMVRCCEFAMGAWVGEDEDDEYDGNGSGSGSESEDEGGEERFELP